MDKETIVPNTIKEIFNGQCSIRIPAYQRAYSWEDKQCQQFLNDLLEQKGKRYYLGQFLFEQDGGVLYVIDGQQRLTTTVIFLSALAKVDVERGNNIDLIKCTYLTDIFKTIDDDQILFKKITRKHLISTIDDTETISQRRIIDAFCFFEAALHKLDNVDLSNTRETLEDAVISTFYIKSKIEATQVFEYQNNRGKELSRLEIIKAYLMHQVYLHSTDSIQANNDISEIQSMVSKLYRYIEAVEGYFTENELINNYCELFLNIDGRIDIIKEKLSNEPSKINWIKAFFENFVEILHSAKGIVANKKNPAIANLFFVGNEANWKLVLLTLFHKGDVLNPHYKRILKLLEILCYKLKLGDYRTDYLPRYAKLYFSSANNYSIENLHDDIKVAAEIGFKWYWNDNNRFRDIITSYFTNERFHYNLSTIKYILWQYENHLRIKNRSGALLDKNLYDTYTIEHIAPQNPNDNKYTEDFKQNYLHLAGNLALLTQSQNSKFGNKPFTEKSELFQDTALSSYTEIRVKPYWSELEIRERHNVISSFAIQYFDTEAII